MLATTVDMTAKNHIFAGVLVLAIFAGIFWSYRKKIRLPMKTKQDPLGQEIYGKYLTQHEPHEENLMCLENDYYSAHDSTDRFLKSRFLRR